MKYVIIFIFLLITIVVGQDTLIVDLHEYKPLVIKNDGNYTGHDVELWNAIAKDNNFVFKYNFVNDFNSVIHRVNNQQCDASIGGLSMTYERECNSNFSLPYMHSGSGILIKVDVGWRAKIWKTIVFYVNLFLTIIPFLIFWILYICIGAIAIWYCEIGNPMFDDKFKKGFPDARFFVHVVISSTGFGNQVPESKLGRKITVILMYSGIGFMFPMITGKISSEMTAAKFEYVMNVSDLKGRNVAVKKGTTASKSTKLKTVGVKLQSTNNLDEAVVALLSGKVDAVVHDRPALKYISQQVEGVKVVNELFDIQDYAIVLPNSSPLQEKINRSILKFKENGFLDELSLKWLDTNVK